MDVATFRADFPEFANVAKYPDGRINFFMGLARKLLPADRWDDMLDYGIELYVAHEMALSVRQFLVASVGGIPGAVNGVMTAKAVDKVSASYDVANVQLENGGTWNLTIYGIKYLQLARMFGAGAIQL